MHIMKVKKITEVIGVSNQERIKKFDKRKLTSSLEY